MILSINADNPQPRLIRQVIHHLKQGGIICYPTDTVYGIGCDIFNQKAIKRIYQIKKRAKHKPFSFMCCSLKNVSTYCHISNMGYRIMRKVLPGPYTFILPAAKIVPKIMITKQKTVGIRVPDNNICMALVRELGYPILTTSAIFDYDSEPITQAYQVESFWGHEINIIIDGGQIYPEPSSIVSLIDDVPEVLREGKGETGCF